MVGVPVSECSGTRLRIRMLTGAVLTVWTLPSDAVATVRAIVADMVDVSPTNVLLRSMPNAAPLQLGVTMQEIDHNGTLWLTLNLRGGSVDALDSER